MPQRDEGRAPRPLPPPTLTTPGSPPGPLRPAASALAAQSDGPEPPAAQRTDGEPPPTPPPPPAPPPAPASSSPPGAAPDNEHAFEDERGRFPAFILAVPGVLCLLFAASADKMVSVLGGVGLAIGVGGAAALGAALSFGYLATHAQTREGRAIGAAVVGLALLLYSAALLRLI